MAQNDSNSEDALDDLVSRVLSRRAAGRRPFVSEPPPVDGLKPSEILFMSGDKKKLDYYLSHQRYARFDEIVQAVGLGHEQILKMLSDLKLEGYVHDARVDGEIHYRIKFVDTSVKNNTLPKELRDTLSLDSKTFLRQLPLFKKLTESDLGFINRQFRQEHYARNDVILRQGELVKSFFIIKSGVVAVSNLSSGGDDNLLRYLEQGDFFGEGGLLTSQSASATIIAFTPVDLLVINKDDFYTMLAKHVSVAIELAKTLAYRLSDMNTRLANKSAAPNLFFVVSTGKQSGTTVIANAMALMLATSKTPTVLLEFPGEELASLYEFSPTDELFNHPGGFQVLNPKSRADVSEPERAILAMDQASLQFKNIVLSIPWECAEHVDVLLRSASQIVVVSSAWQEDWARAQKVSAALKKHIRTNKTRLFTLVTQNQASLVGELTDTAPDFMVSVPGDLPPIAERRLEHLPKPLTTALVEIFKLLGYSSQVGIYLPASVGAGQPADISAQVEKTLTFMGKLFGRATHERIQGVRNSQEAGLVEDDVHLVRSFCSQPVLDTHIGEVIDYVEVLKQELQQEALALEVNQKLMLI